MIYDYEIKEINGEETLFLYFDLDSEFAKFSFNKNINKLEDIVKNFIKENNINFKGATVAIIVGGLLVCNISFNKVNNKNMNIVQPQLIKESIILPENNDEIKIDNTVENQIINEKSQKEVNNKDAIYSSDSVNNYYNKIPSSNQNISANSNKTDNNNLNKISQEESQMMTQEKINIENPQEKVEDNNIYVTIHRSNGQIINLELEEYIIGVVGAEMPASFNIEALKSQAILARTYALKSIDNNKILTDNSSTQNYKNNDELKKIWGGDFDKYYSKIKNAVNSTKGLYLTYNGDKIEAVYHSTSNGYTEDSVNVWGNSFPYLVSVESKYDITNKSFEAEKFISYNDLSIKLNMEINNSTSFNILGRTSGNRIDYIEINGNVYSGVKIRSLLGLRSADFDIIKSDNGITFKTRGYGHGVGLSQYGANGMANAGYTYNQILKHYYKGIDISHI